MFAFFIGLCYHLYMNLTEIIKAQSFFENIMTKKENGTLKNSLLFFCEDNLTSSTTLILMALMLQYPSFQLMNEKSAEFVKIKSGVDLDVKIFPKNGEKLLVADSGDIVAEAAIKAVNLPYKIFIINNIDVSTEEAQNKLLKVLEEPSKNVFFLLSAQSEERVLATIKSRCDKVKINPLCEEDLAKVCSDPLAITLGGGFVGKTLSLCKDGELSAVVNFAVSLLSELKSSKQVILFSKKFLEFKGKTELILQVMSLCLEDLIKLKCESEKLCKMKMFKDELAAVEPEFSVLAICEIAKLISALREKMEFNANITVAVDNFLLKMLEVKYLCK